jgi:hypothetical protein
MGDAWGTAPWLEEPVTLHGIAQIEQAAPQHSTAQTAAM